MRMWRWWCEIPDWSRYANRGQLISGLLIISFAMFLPIFCGAMLLAHFGVKPHLGSGLALVFAVVYTHLWLMPATRILDWWWS